MKYLQTFEKLGVSDDVAKVADWIWGELIKRKEKLLDKKPVSFPVPIRGFEGFGVPELKDLIVIVHYDMHNLSMHIDKYSTGISGIINLSAYQMNSGIYDNDEQERSYYHHMIVHELHHLLDHLKYYQKNKEVPNHRFDRVFYELGEVSKLFKSDELHDFLMCVYLSSNTEMEARIDQCYHELVGTDMIKGMGKTTKQNFIQNLKKTWVWNDFSDLEKIEKIMRRINKNPLKYYKRILYLKNKKIYQESSSLLDIFNVFRDISQIWKINKESSKIDATEEQARGFFNQTEKYIISQREKMRRKLYKLSGHFI